MPLCTAAGSEFQFLCSLFRKDVLGAYNNQDITISLPDGLTLRDIKWIAVWCREYEVNGDGI